MKVRSKEEIADVLEVTKAILSAEGISQAEIEEIRNKKAPRREFKKIVES